MESLPPMGDPNAPQQTSTTITMDRPGCVTLYVYSIVFVAVILPLSALLGILSNRGASTGLRLGAIALLAVVTLSLHIVLGVYLRGLWRMRNWARVLTLFIVGILFIRGFIELIQTLRFGFVAETSVVIGSILICACVFVWFAVNRYKFD